MRVFTEQELRAKSKTLLDLGVSVIALSNGAIYKDSDYGAAMARLYQKKYKLKSYTFKGKAKSAKSKTSKKA